MLSSEDLAELEANEGIDHWEHSRKRFASKLGIAIEKAAENLPQWWHIEISVECGGGMVTLVDPSGEDVDQSEYEGDDLADTITVLDQGMILFEGSPREVRGSEVVRRRYLGEVW